MGFEILPIEKGEIDEHDPKLDIFEITADNQWTPANFRLHLGTTEDAPNLGGQSPKNDFVKLDNDFLTNSENPQNQDTTISVDSINSFLNHLRQSSYFLTQCNDVIHQ